MPTEIFIGEIIWYFVFTLTCFNQKQEQEVREGEETGEILVKILIIVELDNKYPGRHYAIPSSFLYVWSWT